jgi:gluconate 2-dehydrogenase gamma chain
MKTNRNDLQNEKKGSAKADYQGPLASGLNRRAFLRTSVAVSMLAGLTVCSAPSSDQKAKTIVTVDDNYFSAEQHQILDAVQMQLFPDDGDGPSARDLNAVKYLEWAMSDQQNIDDDDPTFIADGIGWLNDLAKQTQGDDFIKLSDQQQDKVLKQIAQSSAGENWLSILMYYLTEALMLDPVYGGNPDMIGWQWLQHQPGFPAPIVGKTYRDFT